MTDFADKSIRFLALGAMMLLAACGGGQAAPASSAPAAASAKPSAAAAASAPASVKPAASAAASASAKPAASGSAAAKPAAPLPSGCPAPSAAAAASGAAAAPASGAAPTSAAAKPSFTPQTDVIGEAAPGPYTENTRVTATAGTPVKILSVAGGAGYPFLPNTIVVKAGDMVTINYTNCQAFTHQFVSPALGVTNKVDAPGATDVNITFKAPDKPGKYMFWCPVEPPNGLPHAARGQTGEVIVQ